MTDLRVSCEMVEKKARETRQAEEKVQDLYHNDDGDGDDDDDDDDDNDDNDGDDDDNDDDADAVQAHAEEIDHLRKTSQQLKSQLEGILHKK